MANETLRYWFWSRLISASFSLVRISKSHHFHTTPTFTLKLYAVLIFARHALLVCEALAPSSGAGEANMAVTILRATVATILDLIFYT